MAVKEIFRCIRGFVQVYCAGWCLSEFGCNVFKCEGSSMKPTIKDNDIVLTNQWAVVTDNIHKGDIVIARSMDNPNRLICKRVVAMEEEKVRTGIFHETVPKGHVWLEGDNKSESRDSREYGPVPRGLIIGKVVYKVYPFNERSVIK